MLEIMWEKLKKNYAVLIAIATTLVTIVYAIIKLVIYTYWSGYFKKLNIDNSFIKLDFDGIIYQAVFVFVMLIAIFYMMYILGTIYEQQWTKYKREKDKKFFLFLKMVILNIFVTALLLGVANYPWVMFLCACGNFEMHFATVFVIITLFTVLETAFVIYYLIFEKKPEKKKGSLKNQVAVGILSVLLFSSLILAVVYFSGSEACENTRQIKLVENEQYMITYNDGERYILQRVKIEGSKVIINSNEQKVISNENVECTVKEVGKIDIAD